MKLKLSNEEPESLGSLIFRHRQADMAVKQAEQYREEVKEQVVNRLAEIKQKSFEIPLEGGQHYRATYAHNARISVDADGLKKALGARAFNKLTEPVLSKDKLNAAVADGSVDQVVVAQHLKTTDHPSVRFYVIEQKEEDESGQTSAANE